MMSGMISGMGPQIRKCVASDEQRLLARLFDGLALQAQRKKKEAQIYEVMRWCEVVDVTLMWQQDKETPILFLWA